MGRQGAKRTSAGSSEDPAPENNRVSFKSFTIVANKPHIPIALFCTSKMTTIRAMVPDDLLRISACNLDPLTETYNIGFYLEYLTKWPDLCRVVEGMDGEIEGYSTSYTFSSIPSQLIPPITL